MIVLLIFSLVVVSGLGLSFLLTKVTFLYLRSVLMLLTLLRTEYTKKWQTLGSPDIIPFFGSHKNPIQYLLALLNFAIWIIWKAKPAEEPQDIASLLNSARKSFRHSIIYLLILMFGFIAITTIAFFAQQS